MDNQNKHYRIHTRVGENETEKYITVNLEQDYDVIDVLSLSIKTQGAYKAQTSKYGVVVGRVLANNGFGIPNAKLSLFIPKNDEINVVLDTIYPFLSTASTNSDGVRYNLLPDEKVDDCHQVVGTFPNKRLVLDDDNVLEVFDTYYKYTARTNESGDYMMFGVPVGEYTLHMDLDLSDCGKLSQRPRDLMYKGYSADMFENPNQFKESQQLNTLAQIYSQDIGVSVLPFWGNPDSGSELGVTRADIDVQYVFEPTCVFLGSVVSDNTEQGISKKCVPSNRMGEMKNLTTGTGNIEIIRKTITGSIEELQLKGKRLIDGDGTWCFQIPMNLDYVMTDEYGNIVPTNNPKKGIPTRCEVRFRLSLDEEGGSLPTYHRGKVLIPNNPSTSSETDYNFGSYTKDFSFRSLYWNNVYTVKSFIPRIQRSAQVDRIERFTGIKATNHSNGNNPMPYNNIRTRFPLMFTLSCWLQKAYIGIVRFLNYFYYSLMILSLGIAKMRWAYMTSDMCPSLEGWYFAPGMSLEKNNKGKLRKWVNKTLCRTYKNILEENGLEGGEGVNYYGLKAFTETDVLPAFEDGTVPKGKAYRYSIVGVATEITETEYDSEKGNKPTSSVFAIKREVGNVNDDDTIDNWKEDTSLSKSTNPYWDEFWNSCWEKKTIAPDYDKMSESLKNTYLTQSTPIYLTNKVDYLKQCMESALAEEYEVLQFDFYNDWINGCIYLPRWARTWKNKKKGLYRGCIDGTKGIGSTKRRYFQVCSLEYDSDNKIVNDVNCNSAYPNKNAGQCHKKNGAKSVPVLNTNNVGLIHETKTMLNENVYYLKARDFTKSTPVPLFATDIVWLGSLLDRNEYGLPVILDNYPSTTYRMPPNIVQTNQDEDSYAYISSDGSLSEITVNAITRYNCDKINEDLGPYAKENGVKPVLPTAEVIQDRINFLTGGIKYYTVKDNSVTFTGLIVDTAYVYTVNGVNNELIATGTTQTVTINAADNTEVRIAPKADISYDDIFPITEMAGIDWQMSGPEFFDDKNNGIFAPGGHFMALDCTGADTNIKSCVNLQRACELGASLSARQEIALNKNGDSFLYLVPNGLISNDEVIDKPFRSVFATMNHTGLRTKIDSITGYRKYDLEYLYPDTFDGSLSEKVGVLNKQIKMSYDADKLEYANDIISADFETEHTITRSLETTSNDYWAYRMGDIDTSKWTWLIKETNRNVEKKSLPVFNNSFYFYFGLRPGYTAIDKFKNDYFATCASNTTLAQRGKIKVEPKWLGGVSFDVRVTISDMFAPYLVNFHRKNEDDNIIEINESSFSLGVYTYGDYVLGVTDSAGNNKTISVSVGKNLFNVDYDKTSIVNYKVKIGDANDLDTFVEWNGSNGGFLTNSTFNIIVNNIERIGYYVKILNVDNGLYVESNDRYWSRLFQADESKLVLFGAGTYKLYIVYYDSTTDTKTEILYDTFYVEDGSADYSIVIGSEKHNVFDSSLLQKTGRWWDTEDLSFAETRALYDRNFYSERNSIKEPITIYVTGQDATDFEEIKLGYGEKYDSTNDIVTVSPDLIFDSDNEYFLGKDNKGFANFRTTAYDLIRPYSYYYALKLRDSDYFINPCSKGKFEKSGDSVVFIPLVQTNPLLIFVHRATEQGQKEVMMVLNEDGTYKVAMCTEIVTDKGSLISVENADDTWVDGATVMMTRPLSIDKIYNPFKPNLSIIVNGDETSINFLADETGEVNDGSLAGTIGTIVDIQKDDITITEGYPENEEWPSDELAHLYYPNNLDKLGEVMTPDGNTVIEVKWHMSTRTFVRIYSQSKTKVANAYLSMQIENNGHNISNWETILGDETTSDITIHFYVNQLSHKQYKEGIEYRSCYLYELKVVE